MLYLDASWFWLFGSVVGVVGGVNFYAGLQVGRKKGYRKGAEEVLEIWKEHNRDMEEMNVE